MNKAVYLVKNSELKTYEISEIVGYENVSYFQRKFKEKFGMTPKRYRQEVKKDKDYE